MEIFRVHHHSRWLHHIKKSKSRNMDRSSMKCRLQCHLVGVPRGTQVEGIGKFLLFFSCVPWFSFSLFLMWIGDVRQHRWDFKLILSHTKGMKMKILVRTGGDWHRDQWKGIVLSIFLDPWRFRVEWEFQKGSKRKAAKRSVSKKCSDKTLFWLWHYLDPS